MKNENFSNKLGEDNVADITDVSELIIENFLAVIERVPMLEQDRQRIIRLLNLCVEKLGVVITADALYTEQDSNPDDYFDIWEMTENEEI